MDGMHTEVNIQAVSSKLVSHEICACEICSNFYTIMHAQKWLHCQLKMLILDTAINNPVKL